MNNTLGLKLGCGLIFVGFCVVLYILSTLFHNHKQLENNGREAMRIASSLRFYVEDNETFPQSIHELYKYINDVDWSDANLTDWDYQKYKLLKRSVNYANEYEIPFIVEKINGRLMYNSYVVYTSTQIGVESRDYIKAWSEWNENINDEGGDMSQLDFPTPARKKGQYRPE